MSRTAVTTRGRVTIPKRLRNYLGLSPGDKLRFEYADDLTAAQADGFESFVEFPEEEKIHESTSMFATFSQRVPSRSRPDFRRLMLAWGVERDDDPFEILARSCGVQLTDEVRLRSAQ